jgi:hypothetical protein
MKLNRRLRSWQVIALGLSQSLAPLALAQTPPAAPSVIPSRVAPATLEWRAKLGAERAWRVQYRGSAEVDYSLAAAAMTRSLGTATVAGAHELSRVQQLDYDLAAVLHTRVVSVERDGWTVAARLSDVRYAVDGQLDGRRELFEAPFLVRFDGAGRMQSFEFMKKYPKALEQAVMRLVEPLQVVLAAPTATSWSAEERGSDTTYLASYAVTGVTGGQASLTKAKTRITKSVLDRAELVMPGQREARITQSDTRLTFDLARHAVTHLESKETISLRVGGARFTDDTHTFSATEVAVPTTAALPTTLPGAQAALADPAFAHARLYDVDAHTLPLVQGLDAPAALAAYRAHVTENLGLGVRELSAWLRLNPGQALTVAKAIDGLDPVADERAFGFGWAALASAGHREAQAALLQAATTHGWKPESQEQALIAMMSLELPEPALADAVWKLRMTLAARETSGAVGAKLSITTNVYGALGDVSKGSPLTAQVTRNLTTLLSDGHPNHQVLALDALSNVGGAPVASLAAPYLSSTDERVRMAAFGAFRRAGAASLPAFAAAYAAEPSAEVRLSAARTAAQMTDSEALVQWARAAIVSEAHPAVKRELVHVLGKSTAQREQNLATLKELLRTTAERPVRRDIYVYVSPTAGGRP